MYQIKHFFIFLFLFLLAFSVRCQTDTSTIKVKIFKRKQAPLIIPVITDKGVLEKLTAKGCTDGEVRWFDAKDIFIGKDDLIVQNLMGKIKAICLSNQTCPSDTSIFEIDKDFTGKIERTDNQKIVCFGSEISLNIGGCNGKIYWHDAFRQIEFRNIKVLQNDTLKYNFRCLEENGLSKYVNISIPITKATLENLVLFPNPTFEWLKLKSNGCLNGVKCRIFNIIGQNIYEGWAESIDNILQINVSNLPSDEYILEMSLAETGESVVKRFIKLSKL